MKQSFSINGMSCNHCVNRVEQALAELPGVQKVKVNLKKKSSVVKFDETQVSSERIIQSIETAGYEASLI